VPGDCLNDMRWGAQFKQKTHNRVSEVMQADARQSSLSPDAFPVGVEASGLDGCADAGGEDKIVVAPQFACGARI
jgi:hypothetical protein